jgi:hypothetical protein
MGSLSEKAFAKRGEEMVAIVPAAIPAVLINLRRVIAPLIELSPVGETFPVIVFFIIVNNMMERYKDYDYKTIREDRNSKKRSTGKEQ